MEEDVVIGVGLATELVLDNDVVRAEGHEVALPSNLPKHSEKYGGVLESDEGAGSLAHVFDVIVILIYDVYQFELSGSEAAGRGREGEVVAGLSLRRGLRMAIPRRRLLPSFRKTQHHRGPCEDFLHSRRD